jgi:DNA polymerase-4
VRGLRAIRGTSVEIARQLRADVRSRVGLALTVGVANTKFLAKVASGVGKPDGLLVVPTGGELDFLHPLPVRRLWGVGAVTAAKLHAYGIETVAQVADQDERTLVAMLGPASGRHLHALAHNRDPRRVDTGRRRRSIGAQSAFGRRTMSAADLDARLLMLVDRVCRRLRAANRVCRTVTLRLRFYDFSRATRSHTLPAPTADTITVHAALRLLLRDNAAVIRENGITLLGVTLGNLDSAASQQLELPFGMRSAPDLDSAVDRVRDKYGSASLTRGVLLHRDPGLQVPLLPD